MKHFTLYKKIVVTAGAALLLSMQACLKSSDEPLTPGAAIPFKGSDVAASLATENSVQLFTRAFKRVGLSAEVTNDAGYTIFAPVDSAMKAVGLDEAGIDKMNIDSLRHLVAYQVLIGSLSQEALHNLITPAYVKTVDRKLVKGSNGSTSYEAATMYIEEDGRLYMNGVAITQRSAATASTNGFIYPVTAFASRIPERTMIDVLSTDPDLSMYYETLQIQDSILVANLWQGDLQKIAATPATAGMYATILAPTNKAFIAAGFKTMQDVRDYATSTYVGFDMETFLTYYFSPMDTVICKHILFNQSLFQSYDGTGNTVRIFYNDFMKSGFNNGKVNVYTMLEGLNPALNYDRPLTFSSNNGEAYVKYDKDPATAAVRIPRDASPMQSVNNYITSNGCIYKIDKLFYPANK